MDIQAFTELFPLFDTANPETLKLLIANVVEHEYPKDKVLILEDSWGNAIYLIAAGWVKVRRFVEDHSTTLAILSKGDFFGEMAILDEAPRSTDVISISEVKLFSIAAEPFTQALLQDSRLQYRLLQLMVRRLRQFNGRFQIRDQPPAIKLAKILVTLAENYGKSTQKGTAIFNIPDRDLADIADITLEEAQKILEKLASRNWLQIDSNNQILYLINLKQLNQLAEKI